MVNLIKVYLIRQYSLDQGMDYDYSNMFLHRINYYVKGYINIFILIKQFNTL